MLNVRIVSQELAKLCVRWSYLFQTERVVSCERRECKKMVFPAAIREKSQRRVALSCDAHVVFASSGEIRQPCTFSLSDLVLVRTFFSSQHFCAGNSLNTIYQLIMLITTSRLRQLTEYYAVMEGPNTASEHTEEYKW